jgi:hypothetical protein
MPKEPKSFGEILDHIMGKEILIDGFSKPKGKVEVTDMYGRKEQVSVDDYNFVRQFTLPENILVDIKEKYKHCF